MTYQLAVVSGKGGTGKTTVAAALADLAGSVVMADCDVEAPNLHLVLPHETLREQEFYGNRVATIDREACIDCGVCEPVCRFGAIRWKDGEYEVEDATCEGCGACTFVCPQDAVTLEPRRTGTVKLAKAPGGSFAHAELALAADGSGKLVTEVRQLATAEARASGQDVIIDGAPGTGCVVISTMTGCQAVLAVTEPTKSGWHDLERALNVAEHFRIATFVAINKWDICPEMTEEIEERCGERKVTVVGRIPWDPAVAEAMTRQKPVTQIGGPAAEAIRAIWAEMSARRPRQLRIEEV